MEENILKYKNGKFLNIAVASAGINGYYQGQMMQGMLKYVSEHTAKLMIFSPFSNTTEKSLHDLGEESIYQLINYDSIDGLIIIPKAMTCKENTDRVIENCKKHNVPVVSIDSFIDYAYNIITDFSFGITQLTRHLIELHGIREFGFFGGLKGENEATDQRFDAFLSELKLHDIELDENQIFYAEFSDVIAKKIMDKYLEDGNKPVEAYVCGNDSMAISVANSLIEHGYQVPDDVMVTGCDGIDQAFSNIPTITTVRMPFNEAGYKACEMLEELCVNKDSCTDVVLENEMIEGMSCGCTYMDYSFYNKNTNELIAREWRYSFYSKRLIRMSEEMSYLSETSELLNVVEKYMADIYADHFFFCLCSDYDDYKRYESEYVYNDECFTDKIIVAKYKRYDKFMPQMVIDRSEIVPNYVSEDMKSNAFIISPVHFKEKVYGYTAVSCDGYHGNAFLFNWWLTTVGISIADVVFKNEFINNVSKLEKMYVEDVLTGLYNRRGFFISVEKLLMEKESKSVMIFCADMDNLKSINDIHGHTSGDFALTLLGNSLKAASIKGSEICARVGGDEFYVMGMDYTENMAADFCTRFINELNRRNGEARKPFKIEVSYGYIVADIDESVTNLDEYITIADTRMYAQKRFRKERHFG